MSKENSLFAFPKKSCFHSNFTLSNCQSFVGGLTSFASRVVDDVLYKTDLHVNSLVWCNYIFFNLITQKKKVLHLGKDSHMVISFPSFLYLKNIFYRFASSSIKNVNFLVYKSTSSLVETVILLFVDVHLLGNAQLQNGIRF